MAKEPSILEQAQGYLTYQDDLDVKDKLKQVAGIYFSVAHQKAQQDLQRAVVTAQRKQRYDNLYAQYREQKTERKWTEKDIDAMIATDAVYTQLTDELDRMEVWSRLHLEMLTALRMSENIGVVLLGGLNQERRMAAKS